MSNLLLQLKLNKNEKMAVAEKKFFILNFISLLVYFISNK